MPAVPARTERRARRRLPWAAKCVDDVRAPRERTVDNVVNVLGIQPLAKEGGSHHVQKHDSDLLELLCTFGGRYLPCYQLAAQRGHADIDDRATKKRSLRFQSSYGGLDSKVRGHRCEDSN